jgi:hypothetical protein
MQGKREQRGVEDEHQQNFEQKLGTARIAEQY